MSKLSDEELSRAVALRCGWIDVLPEAKNYGIEMYRSACSHKPERPVFATSLDACFGRGGPIEYMKTKNWEIRLTWYSEHAEQWECFIEWDYKEEDRSIALDDNPARALCLAFLAATEGE